MPLRATLRAGDPNLQRGTAAANRRRARPSGSMHSSAGMRTMTLLAVESVRKIYKPRKREAEVVALDDVSLAIEAGECLGLVGESGSGKSTLARLILALEAPSSGTIRYGGEDLAQLSAPGLLRLREKMQIVFQDPHASLNPRMTIHDIVAEPLVIHQRQRPMGARARRDRVVELLATVGLKREHLWRYPHEFSGGQRQRICIARALALEPEFLILDEPTSALDVSVQAQVLNMLQELQQRLKLTYLFISHDLGVIRYMADRVTVMQHGRIVEGGATEAVFRAPQTDYAKSLIAASEAGELDAIR
jgi:ABC-type glutathione transport system ATPase component